MTTEALELAIISTRGVLANVSKDQLDDPTPCAQWKVRELINHIVGGQYFFEAGVLGKPPAGEGDFAAGDFVADFDTGSSACLAAFRTDGVMEQVLKMPFGEMPGSVVVGIAASDTFVHGWDLAKATGQSTDLNPELAAGLLPAAKAMISDAFRSPEGTVFGPEQTAPAGATNADQLAAFTGRIV